MRKKWRAVCALAAAFSLLLGNTSLALAPSENAALERKNGLPRTEEAVETEEKEIIDAEKEAEAGPVSGEESPQSGRYYGWQTMDEILALCEKGLDLQEFFRYTIWGFLTREDIQALADHGHTLDDVYEAIDDDSAEVPEDIQRVLDAYGAAPMPMSLGDTRTAGFFCSLSRDLGCIPAFGSNNHGTMSKIHLSGETAFCAKFGAPLRAGMVYTSVPLSEIGIDSGKERLIRGLLAHYAEAQSIYSGPANYILIQASIWLVVNGTWTGNADQMAAEITPLFSKTPDCPSAAFAADYFRAIVAWLADSSHEAQIEAIGLEGWANGPNQYLLTATGDGGSLEEPKAYAHIELTKTDRETGNVIADDAEFTIYEWNGSGYESSRAIMHRDKDRYYSDDLVRTEQNEGKFCLEEASAPHTGSVTGYYGDFEGASKKTYEFEVEEGMKGDAIFIANAGNTFENQRVTGSIRIFKTDIEADAYVAGESSHGEASLDGAIYDLYAKEAVYHPDGVTGVLYKKDAFVASGTIKEGTCIFENLYLGKYYVKERQKGETLEDGKKLSYARGYLLDETVYDVELPYEGEAVANVHREVHSDKEQVIKARAVFEKVESAAGQGNINYLEGAGFTIYRIDKLSRRERFVKNADGDYEEKSIQDAYLVKAYDQSTPKYDFRGEEEAIATLYMRETTKREETSHYWQEGKEDLKAGKLHSLGGNYYQVAELFSDGSGQIVTPYLPYGQYLVVETTVPKDHFAAPPFVLSFYQNKSNKILTVGVKETTPYGKNLLKSAGDTLSPCEAVYFSGVVDNEAVEELLRLYKRDADTKETVLLANTAFRIAKLVEGTEEKQYLTHTSYYPDTVNQEIFYTNENGWLQLPELLPAGMYQIEEVEGPSGFYNDIPGGYVRFRVTTDRTYMSLLGGGPEGSTLEGSLGKRDVLLILENYENRETRGMLTIKKRGEVLTGYKNVSLLENVRQFFGLDARKQFVYEELPLSHGEYTIRAAEDIVTQDRQVDQDGNRRLWFHKGEVAAVVTTGEEGQIDEVKVKTEEWPDGHPIVTVVHDGTLGSVKVYLPLGSYEVEETKAPYGYTREKEIQKVTFTWEHQFQEFVFNCEPVKDTEFCSYDEKTGVLTLTNRRVKAVLKEDFARAGVGVFKRAREKKEPLADVAFGLYSVDEIYTREGEKLAKAGELLAACVTGPDGKAVFDIDIPIRDEHYGEEEGTNSGAYEIRELQAPKGVLLDTTPIPVLFTYVDDETEFVVIAKEQRNKTSQVYVSKQDAADQTELKGAELMIRERWSGRAAKRWTSDGTKREIRGLAINTGVEDNTYLYTLQEISAPAGYYTANEILFKLVEESSEEGELENYVYIYDPMERSWNKALENTIIMKDTRRPEVPLEPEPEDKKPPHTEPDSKPYSEPEPVPVPATGDGGAFGIYFVLLLLAAAGRILCSILEKRR